MSPLKVKRPSSDFIETPRKRQKADAANSKKKSGTSAEAAFLDQLAWKEVIIPDRFDDAEGFFGLEEIDDVDIVRDAGNGKVQYRLNAGASEPKILSEPSLVSKVDVQTATVNDVVEEAPEWEGFNGIQDSEPITSGTSKVLTRDLTADRDAKKSAKKTKGKGSKASHRPSSATGTGKQPDKNAFGVLEESDDDNNIDVSAWQALNLSPVTLSSLAKMKYSRPTPIQNSTIPEILRGHDVIGKAATGSGKTLAFGIPILEHYISKRAEEELDAATKGSERKYPPVAMILSPTRELAHQISAHLTDLCSNTVVASPRIVTLTGGLSLQKQQRLLANADIIVGTPGRLWETISTGQGLLTWLRQIKYLVVDEADRLLSEGHFKEVEEILNSLDREDEESGDSGKEVKHELTGKGQRQTLVFSATFQKELQQKLGGKSKFSRGDIMGKQESMEYLLEKLNFREEKPKFIDVNPVSQMASGLREGIVECAGLEKDLYLYALLLHQPNTRTLIFTNSISAVRRLTPFLQNLNIPAHALHSQMPQKARLRSVEHFSSPSHPSSILIATDVAARGLDIPSVQLVVHYHLPRAADMYVHRSGRTARAEKSGSSILLCAPEEVLGVRRLVAKVHARSTVHQADKSKKFFMRTIELDRRIVARLKPRVTLAKKISDASLAKEKKGHDDNWLKTAADDLGVEYDSEDFAAQGGSKKGRGSGRMKAEKEARGLSKGELAALRAELKGMLSQRVNVGVSERYLSAGGVDVDELLRETSRGEFLGKVDGLGMD